MAAASVSALRRRSRAAAISSAEHPNEWSAAGLRAHDAGGCEFLG
jgi:hypothetical protein